MKPKPSWIRAHVSGQVDAFGDIHLTVNELEHRMEKKPSSIAEVPGADEEAFARLRSRSIGEFETWSWAGGATALMVPFDRLQIFSDQRDRLFGRLVEKYGPWENEWAILCAVRNTGAPVIWNCAEPSGGMAESEDLVLEQVLEIVEIGLYNDSGWIGFYAKDLSKTQRDALITEQRDCWQIADPELPRSVTDVFLKHLQLGNDVYNGRCGIINPGPAGDLSLLSFALLELQEGRGYRLRDLEIHHNGKRWIALNRKITAIVHRYGQSPVMFEFGPNGLLDPCGLHMALSGEALEDNISHVARNMLGPSGLDWLI